MRKITRFLIVLLAALNNYPPDSLVISKSVHP